MSLQIQNYDIRLLRQRIKVMLPSIHSFELTKNALIFPFLQLLGLNAQKVKTNKHWTDEGMMIEKCERYIVFQGDNPMVLMECVHHQLPIMEFSNSFIRWTRTTQAKYALLTNGIDYKFYYLNGFTTKGRAAVCEFKVTKTPAVVIHAMLDQYLNSSKGKN